MALTFPIKRRVTITNASVATRQQLALMHYITGAEY